MLVRAEVPRREVRLGILQAGAHAVYRVLRYSHEGRHELLLEDRQEADRAGRGRVFRDRQVPRSTRGKGDREGDIQETEDPAVLSAGGTVEQPCETRGQDGGRGAARRAENHSRGDLPS